MATAPPTGQPRSALRNAGGGMRRKGNLQLEEPNASGASTSASTSVSEPPPSPHQAYFDKYPKRAERIRERNNSNSNSSSKEDKDKHVTIEFPTMQDRKSSWSRQTGGGLRDWRVVQAHLEPKVPKRKDRIRDPDDMVIVSLASPSPSSSSLHHHNTSANHSVCDPTCSTYDHLPPSPSVVSGFRSSLISSAGTLTSSAATEPGALTPPRTPTSPHESVLIASSSVEAMDALIDSMGMGMGSSVSLDTMPFLTPSYARSSRFGYPLYQPPLPTPPEGVKLGIVRDTDATAWKSTKPRGKRPDKSPRRKEWHDDMDDTETEAERRTPSSSTSRTGTPSTTAPSSRTGTPAPPAPVPTSSASSALPTRVKSDEEIEADERADVTSPLVPPTRIRQRSGVSTRSARSARNAAPSVKSGVSGRTLSTSSAGSSVHKARAISRSHAMWDLPNSGDGETESIDAVLSRGERVKERTVVPSIDDIIKMHAPAVVAATKAVSQRSAATPKPPESPTPSKPVEADDLFDPGHSGLDPTRSSVDSIADEAQRALQAIQDTPPPPVGTITPRRPRTANTCASTPTSAPRLQHARSFTGSAPAESASLSPCIRAPFSDGASICSGNSGTTVVLPRSSNPADPTMEMAQYLRSPRLTRLLTLRRPAHAGLTVSLADVGSLTGRPVIVYLGLGCVRYLVALYDEMAEALNLRLICIDRWGLGRTSDVPTDKRGLLEWAGVVEEVADTLGLGRYSVLAHSAGAPYALAGSLKAGERVMGSVHLLAPWVSMAVDGGYKWLKYVPNGLIKTAQAAEWRLQGWMIGKPPTIQYEGIGFDASAPMSPGRVSFSSFSEYDELDDFEGRFGSPTRLALGEGKEGGKERGKVNGGGKDKEKDKEKTGGNKEKTKKPKDLVVSEMGEYRPRKGSKSIFGGLFNNTAPKSTPKRGQSTPPSAQATIKARGPVELEDPAAEECVEPTTPVPIPPVPPIPPIPDQEQPPESPTTPIPPPPTSTPKLKGLRSMSSLKSRSAKSEPGKHTPVGLGLGIDDPDARTQAWASEFADTDRPRQRRSLSLNARPRIMSPTTPVPPSPRSPNPSSSSQAQNQNQGQNQNPKTITLASALLQASHAESLKGGTADLLSILERDSKPWGFSYADVRQPVRVWYGDRDDKIGIGSVRWMERVMKSCEVKIVKGAGHSLMTNAEVVVEVLESIAKEWDQ
ncbi:Hydrolase, partial [Rhizoctonia solani]